MDSKIANHAEGLFCVGIGKNSVLQGNGIGWKALEKVPVFIGMAGRKGHGDEEEVG
jgi:hypothetical protein